MKNTIHSVFRHYGHETYNPDLVLGPVNGHGGLSIKPAGSFWGSPVDSSRSWYDWCIGEDWHLESLETFFDYSISPEARIYQVRSVEDWSAFCRMFPSQEWNFGIDAPDWGKVAEKYDGLFVSLSDCPDLYYAMYGYDVDCLAIWNPDVVQVLC